MQTPNTDWNPALYLKYGKERLQPTIDLVKRIASEAPKAPLSILDVGCGPGNSTAVLKNAWPESRVTGLDSSEAMLDKARESGIKADWILADAQAPNLADSYDLIFSNAAYQWMPDQATVFKGIRENLKPGGIMAAQIPLFYEMPMGRLLKEIAHDPCWADRAAANAGQLMIHSREEYYDILSGLFDRVEIWVTDYVHVMESAEAIRDMMRSTALKPYRTRLGERDYREFEKAVLDGIRNAYPQRDNGKVLFPFKRLFFIAH